MGDRTPREVEGRGPTEEYRHRGPWWKLTVGVRTEGMRRTDSGGLGAQGWVGRLWPPQLPLPLPSWLWAGSALEHPQVPTHLEATTELGEGADF